MLQYRNREGPLWTNKKHVGNAARLGSLLPAVMTSKQLQPDTQTPKTQTLKRAHDSKQFSSVPPSRWKLMWNHVKNSFTSDSRFLQLAWGFGHHQRKTPESTEILQMPKLPRKARAMQTNLRRQPKNKRTACRMRTKICLTGNKLTQPSLQFIGRMFVKKSLNREPEPADFQATYIQTPTVDDLNPALP